MPLAQLFSAGAEAAANQVIALSPHKEALLKPLQGKRLTLKLQELPWSVTCAVSDQLHLLMNDDTAADCIIATRIAVLPQLQDSSQLTRLIKADDLALEGDIHLAQAFADVARKLDIDWEGVLAGYVGDVMAHKLFALTKGGLSAQRQKVEELRQLFSDALLDETPIAAHPLAVADYAQQVTDLRADTDRLEAHVQLLKQRIVTES